MNKIDAINEALYIVVPNIEEIFDNRAKKGSKIVLEKFIEVISKEEYNLSKDLDLSPSSVSLLLKTLFPDRKTTSKPCTYLLGLVKLKWCGHCKQVLTNEEFAQNPSTPTGLNTYCKVCQLNTTKTTQTARSSKYRASKINRTPKWADLEQISVFYNNCPEGYHVDHIIPLNGENVSGLHILENLQYLLAKDNLSKSNKY